MSSKEILCHIIRVTKKKIPYISSKSGVSHQTLYRIHHGQPVSIRTRHKLIRFLNEIDQTSN